MRAIGFPTFRYRLTCFVIAGMLCGLAGVLLANHTDFISPAMMHWTRSGDLIVMVVLGGMGSVFGPVIGARGAAGAGGGAAASSAWSPARHRQAAWRPRNTGRLILGPHAAAGRAVRARRHRRPAGEHAPWLSRCSQIDGLTKRFGGVRRLRRHHARRARGRAARHHRAERRRQDHADRPTHRRDRARMPAASASPASDITALPIYRRSGAGARALVPDHLAVPRLHRARQCRARGAGACRPLVPLLARGAQRGGTARAGARGARARRPRRTRRHAWSPS